MVEVVNFAIQSKTVGKNRTITVDYILTNSSGAYPFQFIATGRVKK